MSEAGFTKGEWAVTNLEGEAWPDKRIGVSALDGPISMSLCICPRFADVESEEVKANMNLIAAAPEMYRMLERCRKAMSKDGYEVEDIDSLLAKARGQ